MYLKIKLILKYILQKTVRFVVDGYTFDIIDPSVINYFKKTKWHQLVPADVSMKFHSLQIIKAPIIQQYFYYCKVKTTKDQKLYYVLKYSKPVIIQQFE